MDIKMYLYEDEGRRTNSTKAKKIEYKNIGFNQILIKDYSIMENVQFKSEYTDAYSLELIMEVCYNIDTYEMYKMGEVEFGGSKEYELLNKAISQKLKENNWSPMGGNDVGLFNYCCKMASKKTRLDTGYFNFEFKFDSFEEMMGFMRYYNDIKGDANILEDYYHLIFIKNRNYKNYLKTKHWNHQREKILKNAKYKCQLCSNKNKLHVHHNTYENIGNEKKEDLIVLCEACHSKFHDK